MQHFMETYQKIDAKHLDLLETIYTSDIHFIDPAHEIHGLSHLTAYFQSLYNNIHTINFKFADWVQQGSEAYVQWQMQFSHPKIKGGQSVTVPGATFLRFSSDDRVAYHRDYFDLGQMIYQHLPLLGRAISHIKRRLGS